MHWLDSQRRDFTLSVVFPAYKAAALLARELPPLLQYFDALGVDLEIVISDDSGSGGDPGTREFAGAHGYRYLAREVNRGKGAAVRAGMLAATGDFRVFTDADVPFDHGAFERALYAWLVQGADVVVGDRRLRGSRYFADVSALRRVGSRAFSQLSRIFFGDERFDTQCGFKGFSSEAAEEIFAQTRIDRFAMDVEILLIALRSGRSIARIPVSLRNAGESSVRMLRDGAVMLRDLVRVHQYARSGRYRFAGPRGAARVFDSVPGE